MTKQVTHYKRLFRLILLMPALFTIITGCNKADEKIAVYSSSQDGDRLTKMNELIFKSGEASSLPHITINERKLFQKMDGFGASFNEAGMICLNSLTAENRQDVLKMLFDPESGAGYSLMKSPIAACDFSSAGRWYSYNDTPGDTSMINFSIERDLGPNGLIPFIKEARKYGTFELESPMDFAPDWMYYSLRDGEKHIKPEYYRALARYYSKYLRAYSDNGITIKYLNLFNEAENRWYSNVTYETIGLLIKDYVVPQLKEDGISVNIQLGETANRPEALEKFPSVLADSGVFKNIHSLTVHGYDWNKFSSISELHDKYPELPIWMTEVCYVTGSHFPKGGPEKSPVYDFADGELWGNMIMNDINNWVSAWIYWNMILDQDGGPWLVAPEHGNPDPNQQHAVVIINRDSGEISYTGLYYYLAHFSKFIKPGAYRIETTGGSSSLNYAGFLNPDGSIVVNVINNAEESVFELQWKNKITSYRFPAHSITTLIWNTNEESQDN